MTSVPDLCDAVAVLVGYLEGEIADLEQVGTDRAALASEACAAPVVPLEAARLLRRARLGSPVRQTQLEDLREDLDDARQALQCLAGIGASHHPPYRTGA